MRQTVGCNHQGVVAANADPIPKTDNTENKNIFFMCASSSLVVYFTKILFFLPVIYYSVVVSSDQIEYIVIGPVHIDGLVPLLP